MVIHYVRAKNGAVYKNIRYAGPKAAPSRAHFGPDTERKE